MLAIRSAQSAQVIWDSGILTLPSGNVATENIVSGMAWITTSMSCASTLHSISALAFYNALNSGNPIDNIPANTHVKGNTWTTSGKSDSSGTISMTDGINGPSTFNEWAVVLYKCIEDGYEWYMKIDAGHYVTGYNNETDNRNSELASYGTWIRGEAIPEPSSSMLALCGLTILLLQRRK